MPSAPPIAGVSYETSDHARQRATGASAFVTPDFRPPNARARVLDSVAGIVRRALESRHDDRSFERPDLIEDDYYRFRNQPRD